MSALTELFRKSFFEIEKENCNFGTYQNGPWSIRFTHSKDYAFNFELFYQRNNTSTKNCVLRGNTSKPELSVENLELLSKTVVMEVEDALPQHCFDIYLNVMVPLDFNGYWLWEFDEDLDWYTIQKDVCIDIENRNYGYDVRELKVSKLSDVNNIIFKDETGSFKVEDFCICTHVEKGSFVVAPLSYIPVKEKESFKDKINKAEARKHEQTNIQEKESIIKSKERE